MKLYICEKPSQAADIAKVLGNARKTQTHWETAGGRVTWCYGHLLELFEPDDYDARYKNWSFADLPIIPERFRFSAKRDAASQLKAIGQLLKDCSSVVISTDADREGEMIGREVLEHHRYTGRVERLWLSALDEESVRKALSRLKPGEETVNLYRAALARSEADWLVGMNMTRAMTVKQTKRDGVFSVGRVQTPTVALVVRRDLAIENFKPRDYFEVRAEVATGKGPVTLVFGPRDEEQRMWERAKADAIATAARGAQVTLQRTSEDKRQGPPKLFSLSGLQKRANSLWGWSADKTLDVAQSLYETHKATTYPRTDCVYLPEEQISDVPTIRANLLALDKFRHLAGKTFSTRKSVFDTSKITAHHAIIPTKVAAPLQAMSEDERKAYFLIAAHYLAAQLPDYEYKSTKLAATAAGVEFTATGNTPTKQGWKEAFGKAESDEEEGEGETTLPDIPHGTPGAIERTAVDGKQTKAPPRYTEGTLIEDMKSVAKYVTDPAKKARLKESSGIGTEATRANIIKTIKAREYVVTKGKQIISTPKGRAFIATLEQENPALADPAETAVWEDGLESVADGKQAPDAFVNAVGARIRDYLKPLAAKSDAPQAQGPAGAGTGIKIGNDEILDHGEYFTAGTAFKGRIYKAFFGHKLTPDEIVSMVDAKAVIELTDCTSKDGQPSGPKKAHYNPDKKPWPGVEFFVESQATGVVTEKKRGKGGSIEDCGDHYMVEGYESNGRPVKFWKRFAGRDLSAEELAKILAAGAEGHHLDGFKNDRGTYGKRVKYNARKKPYAGLEFAD